MGTNKAARFFQLLAVALGALVLLKTAFAADEDCAPFRLDGPSGSMEHIDVHDQDGVGICYSFSGSDLVNAALAKMVPPAPPVSPLASAILASKKFGRKVQTDDDGHHDFPFEDDDECTVVNYIREHGYCDDDTISKKLGPTTYETSERIYRPFQNYGKQMPDAALKIACDLQSSLPGAISPPLEDLKQAISKAAPLSYFKAVATQACTSTHPAPIPPCLNVKVSGPAHFRQLLKSHFDRITSTTLPIAIGYCGEVLQIGPEYSGVVEAMRGTPPHKARVCKGYDQDDPDDDGGHSSLVIGRQLDPKTNKCQLLIKNSWGLSKNNYSGAWTPENGKVWVDLDALERNVFDVSSF